MPVMNWRPLCIAGLSLGIPNSLRAKYASTLVEMSPGVPYPMFHLHNKIMESVSIFGFAKEAGKYFERAKGSALKSAEVKQILHRKYLLTRHLSAGLIRAHA